MNNIEDPETELALLGACIAGGVSREAISFLIANKCNEQWFCSVIHRKIWKLIIKMYDEGKQIDLITISAYAKQSGMTKDIGSELMEALDKCLVPSNYRTYADIVKNLYQKRLIHESLSRNIEIVKSDARAVDIIDGIQFDINNISVHPDDEKTPEGITDKIMADCNHARGKGFIYLPSRWIPLQNKLAGYRKGKVVVIAARPGKGKSTLMCNEANSLIRKGFRAGIISLEMDAEELYMKMACDLTQLDLFKFISGKATQEDRDILKQALDGLSLKPLFVHDKPSTIRQICNWIRKNVEKKKLDMVFIDYLQLIKGGSVDGSSSSRHELVGGWMHEITECAKSTHCAIAVLAQISRATEPPPGLKPEDWKKYYPRLHNIKESGVVEEDAYQVIFIYPQDPDDASTALSENVPYYFAIEKNRSGPIGRIEMTFRKAKQRFDIMAS